MLSTPVVTQHPEPCPYLPDRISRMESFFGNDLSPVELENYLSSGWRKFGLLYFRPACTRCRECIPLRIDVENFMPTRSQKRVLKKNADTRVVFKDLEYRSEIYKICNEHSRAQFDQVTRKKDLLNNFYQASCPSFQSEYFIDGKLAGVGFIDQSSLGLSSIYFAFAPRFRNYSPGIFSILSEISHCRKMGLKYYYLGYWVENNVHLDYKNNFFPSEKYNWKKSTWEHFPGPDRPKTV